MLKYVVLYPSSELVEFSGLTTSPAGHMVYLVGELTTTSTTSVPTTTTTTTPPPTTTTTTTCWGTNYYNPYYTINGNDIRSAAYDDIITWYCNMSGVGGPSPVYEQHSTPTIGDTLWAPLATCSKLTAGYWLYMETVLTPGPNDRIFVLDSDSKITAIYTPSCIPTTTTTTTTVATTTTTITPTTTTTTSTVYVAVDFSLHATSCTNVRADYFEGGSGEYEISTQLYSTQSEALNGTFASASDPTDYSASENTQYWIVLRDTNNKNNKRARSEVTPVCPTTTTTTTPATTTTTTTESSTTTTSTTEACSGMDITFSLYYENNVGNFSGSYAAANTALCDKLSGKYTTLNGYSVKSNLTYPTVNAVVFNAPTCQLIPTGYYIYRGNVGVGNYQRVVYVVNGYINTVYGEPTCTSCTEISLGYHASSPSTACSNYSSSPGKYHIDTSSFATATEVGNWDDCNNGGYAGYYSNGTIVRRKWYSSGFLDTASNC